MKLQKLIHPILGIIAGIALGFTARVVLNMHTGVTAFLIGVPAGMGVLSLAFSTPEHRRKYRTLIFFPWISVSILMVLFLITGVEDLLCMLILGLPFLAISTIALAIGMLLSKRKHKPGRLKVIALAIPMFIWVVESYWIPDQESYTVVNAVDMAAGSSVIWQHVIRVDDIVDSEYVSGFFNQIGIPRPIKATLSGDSLGGIRTGYFEGGLLFNETITEWKPMQSVSFKIKVDSSSVRNKAFDQHVLNGQSFQFATATYHLVPINQNLTRLELTSRYYLTTRLNFYGAFWANWMISDFQSRLLHTLKKRIERSKSEV